MWWFSEVGFAVSFVEYEQGGVAVTANKTKRFDVVSKPRILSSCSLFQTVNGFVQFAYMIWVFFADRDRGRRNNQPGSDIKSKLISLNVYITITSFK